MRALAQPVYVVLGFFLVGLSTAHAATCEKPVGRLVSLQGTVEARSAEQSAWRAAKLNDSFCPNDAIRTGARSRAALVLTNETIVRLDQLTTLTLSGLDDQATSWVDLLTGTAYFLSRTPRALKIKTPYVNAGVEGTEFVVRVDQDEGSVTVLEGRVRADNPQGAVVLGNGESAGARAGQAPVKHLVVRPLDAVQWSLYYPPLFDSAALAGTANWTGPAQHSFAAYLAGDSAAAFAAIATVPESAADAGYFNYRAALLLVVGRVAEAQADIARSLGLAADNATALALQSVVALARNDRTTALELARKANTRDPESASAWIALSYAQQGMFDLEGARASVEQALRRDPQNVLAEARLSELWLSLGDLDRALETAQRAVVLDPNLARTQTVLGFAYLTQIKTKEAKQAFEQAIARDSADPLPRLGLGLVTIRTGQLEAGRREIEIAAALDPNNALIRSYLGKAYYEEKRDRLAAVQFDMAKQLDPNDPTPWFYDAIRKQTVNRPVEAMQDLQKSIELNNNRAVYRSRLLLDQDLAARSASLSRIYSDLGFQQLALAEGSRSINTDPTSYSAHRFLSDSYVAVPRHEISRASELLQSQLLQPLNIQPLQPQLAATNLAILDGAGPAASGFGEYNPLFVRDRTTVQLNGVVGSQDTWGDDIVVSGIANKTSYSLGQFHYETDGFRPNNDRTYDIYDVFVQQLVSPKLSLQAEYRWQRSEYGDLAYRFDLDSYAPNQRTVVNDKVGRLGLHYQSSVNSDWIASVIHRSRDFSQTNWEIFYGAPLPDPPYVADILGEESNNGNSTAYTAELQFLQRGTGFNYIVGAGYAQSDSANLYVQQGTLQPPLPPVVVFYQDNPTGLDSQYTNAYFYSYYRALPGVTWTLGVSYDAYHRTAFDKDQVNPKLGIEWLVTPSTTVRAAWFTTLKREIVSNQTVEPTQVAGFNQFLDDPNGSYAKRYGVALDQRFSPVVFGGLEASWREIEVPLLNISAMTTTIADQSEQLHRAYLYWTPSREIAVTADYFFEASDQPYLAARNLKTHRAPIGIRYFHPSGFFASLTTSYIDQELEDNDGIKSDRFWLTDAVVGFRLPKRLGVLSLGALNLFDEQFSYYDISSSGFPQTPPFQPNRTVFARIALNF